MKSSGYYGDEGNKDEDYISTWNKGMEQRCMIFRNGNKVKLMGFILSDIVGIEVSIVNSIEISITLIPNMDIIWLQSFRNKKYGKLIIDDLYMYIGKDNSQKKLYWLIMKLWKNKMQYIHLKKTDVRA